MNLVHALLVLFTTAGEPAPIASATRGITGTVTIVIDDGSLRGRSDLNLDSPLLVRVAEIQTLADGHVEYDLEFIGINPGVFDLRDVLMLDDKSGTERLLPIAIEIVTNLASDAPSDLAMTAPPRLGIGGGYVNWLLAIGVAWIAVPCIVIMRRLLRTRETAVVPPHRPTLAEQLAPLVEAAASRTLTVSEQGRLELMLCWHWQERLDLDEPRPAAVAHLRHHEVAGTLLRAVESWLHDPRADSPSRSEIASLLQPYATTRAST